MEVSSRHFWVRYLVATIIWLCLGSTLAIQYATVTLSVTHLDYQSYLEFMVNLRTQVGNPDDIRDGIMVLRSRQSLRREERFVMVQLTFEDGQHETRTIALAVNATNLYVVGYRVEDQAYFFRGTRAEVTDHVFIHASTRTYLSFEENYESLETAAGQERYQIDVGRSPLQGAASTLYWDSVHGITHQQIRRTARSLIICIEMIAEAARNSLIEGRINTRIFNDIESPPDPEMISYMRRWGRISYALQQPIQGIIQPPIHLQNRYGEVIIVYNLNDYCVRSVIALIEYDCQQRPELQYVSPSQQLMIRSVAEALAPTDDTDCKLPEEPTVRIAGPNGMCADVKGGSYANGNPIILYPCKSNMEENQFWTFKIDGTIRSNGKCLTANGTSGDDKSKPGDYVMIFDCPISVVTDRTRWQVFDNGTIRSRTGLVLTAKSWNSGAELTVENIAATTGQSWRPTNNTQPSVGSIIGLHGLCLQAAGNNVWVDKCDSNGVTFSEQSWAIYPDGSIRPQQNRDICLSSSAETGIVELSPCRPQSDGQRWEFRSGGFIMNLFYGMVLDVDRGDPSLKQIIIYPLKSTGNSNQRWFPVF